MFRDGTIPKCERIIVKGGARSNGMYPWGSSVSFTTIFDEGIFDQCLSSARMVIECIVGQLKARFGCLRREMDINL